MRRLISSLCVFVTFLSIDAQAQSTNFVANTVEGVAITYSIKDADKRHVEVVRNNYTAPVITIPDKVYKTGETEPYTVTGIGYQAFQNGGVVKSTVTLPLTIEYIEPDALGYSIWTNPLDIILREGFRSLAGYNFIFEGSINKAQTPNFKLVFPSSLDNLGGHAIYNDCGNKDVEIIDLSKCTKLKSIDQSFEYCSAIKEVYLPEELEEIYPQTFMACGITSVTIPSTVTKIEAGAFDMCPLDTCDLRKVPVVPITSVQGYYAAYYPLPYDVKVVYVHTDRTAGYKSTEVWDMYSDQFIETVNFGPTGYTSLYLATENFEVPTGCTAYIVVDTENDTNGETKAKLKAFAAGSIIPKATGVILEGTPNTSVNYYAAIDLAATSKTEVSTAGNLLIGTGTGEEFSAANHKFYVFASRAGQLGFYHQGTRKGESIKLKANQAGLKLSSSGPAPAKGFILDFEEAKRQLITGVRTATSDTNNDKDVIYNIQGHRVKQTGKGIYIVNGQKKIFNKK